MREKMKRDQVTEFFLLVYDFNFWKSLFNLASSDIFTSLPPFPAFRFSFLSFRFCSASKAESAASISRLEGTVEDASGASRVGASG